MCCASMSSLSCSICPTCVQLRDADTLIYTSPVVGQFTTHKRLDGDTLLTCLVTVALKPGHRGAVIVAGDDDDGAVYDARATITYAGGGPVCISAMSVRFWSPWHGHDTMPPHAFCALPEALAGYTGRGVSMEGVCARDTSRDGCLLTRDLFDVGVGSISAVQRGWRRRRQRIAQARVRRAHQVKLHLHRSCTRRLTPWGAWLSNLP